MKWRRKASRLVAPAAILLAVAAAVLINLSAGMAEARFGLRLDLTSNRLYQLTDTTGQILQALEQPVRVTVFSAREDFVPLLREVLDRYQSAGNGKLQVHWLDPYAHPEAVDALRQKGAEVSLGSIAVEGQTRLRVLKVTDLFTLDEGSGAVQSLHIEQQLTSAVVYTAQSQSVGVQFTDGHNENPSEGMRNLLVRNNCSVGRVTLAVSGIDPATALLVIAAPDRDFPAAEVEKLDAFLARGGRMMIFLKLGGEPLPNLAAFLSEWGMKQLPGVISEEELYTDANRLRILPVYASHPITQRFASRRVYPVAPESGALEQLFLEQGGVRTAKVLYSSDRSTLRSNEELRGPFAVAMTAEKALPGGGDARMFVAAGCGLYDDRLLADASAANAELLVQALNWCIEQDSGASIPAKSVNDKPITVLGYQGVLLSGALMLLLPLAVFGWGMAVWLRRRRL